MGLSRFLENIPVYFALVAVVVENLLACFLIDIFLIDFIRILHVACCVFRVIVILFVSQIEIVLCTECFVNFFVVVVLGD